MRTALIIACIAVISAAGFRISENDPKRYIHKRVTVTPNTLGLPSEPQPRYFKPQVRIPGYKAVAGCGPVPAESSRIVGGTEATPHDWPWQVALYIDATYFCGGSLISDEWVLTAAHCMDGAREVRVVAGAHDLTAIEATQVSTISTDFFTHENWQPLIIHQDIALIRISPITFTDAIQPVCLPTYSTPDLMAGDVVTATGWGKTHDGIGGVSDTLNQVTVSVTSNQVCADYYGDTIINGDIVCIDSIGGHGTCNGDSGGPLNFMDGGKYTTRGITSFGSSAGCESGAPDAFTRVEHYLDWIESHTGIVVDP